MHTTIHTRMHMRTSAHMYVCMCFNIMCSRGFSETCTHTHTHTHFSAHSHAIRYSVYIQMHMYIFIYLFMHCLMPIPNVPRANFQVWA